MESPALTGFRHWLLETGFGNQNKKYLRNFNGLLHKSLAKYLHLIIEAISLLLNSGSKPSLQKRHKIPLAAVSVARIWGNIFVKMRYSDGNK